MRDGEMIVNRQAGRTAFLSRLCSVMFCLLSAVAFFSCRFLLGGETGGQGSVLISFSASRTLSSAGGASRTVVPAADLGITSITVSVAHPGGVSSATVDSVSGICELNGIPVGQITITAQAFAGESLVAEGGADATLSEGDTLSVTVSLASTSFGIGGYALTMRWPESTDAAYLECELTNSSGETISVANPDGNLTPSGGYYSWTCEGSVAAGEYELFITFYTDSNKTTVLGAFVEAVNVYANCTSDTWLNGEGTHLSGRLFTEQEFKDSLIAIQSLTVTGEGLSTEFENLEPNGPAIDIGRITCGTIRFTPVLQAGGAGQGITYRWNNEEPVIIGLGESSAELVLADGESGNQLVITVRASGGDEADYTVTMVKAYRLSYEGNGAESGALPEGGLYRLGETVTISENDDLARTGWVFTGWNTTADGSGTPYGPGETLSMPADGLRLYARWVRNGTVGVSFSLPEYRSLMFTYSGDAVRSLTVTRDELIPLVIGYGNGNGSDWAWYLDGTLDAGVTTGSYSFDRSVTGQYTITCHVTRGGVRYSGDLIVRVVDELRLVYDGNGADGGIVPSGVTFSCGDEVIVSGNAGVPPLTRSGYGWAGWSTDPLAAVPEFTGTGAELLNTNEGSVTLYAVWQNVAPGKVGNLVAKSSINAVTLSWDAPSDKDFAGVRITSPSHGFPEAVVQKGVYGRMYSGLSENTIYTFSVRAYDTAGNTSAEDMVSVYTGVYAAYQPGNDGSVPLPGGGSLDFHVEDDGSITVTSASGATDLVIPASIAGHPVTRIADFAVQSDSEITSLVIPDSITWWGEDAFSLCTSLSSAVLSDSLSFIARAAFAWCENLSSVDLPSNLEAIHDWAFFECTSLVGITIPETVISLGEGCFKACYRLAVVQIHAPTPPTLGLQAFDECPQEMIIYVPASSVDAYRSAPVWSDYADSIRAGTW